MKDPKKSTAYELTLSHARLMAEVENLPSGTEISPEKKKEISDLEQDLRRRLYFLMIGDVLPIKIS